MLEKYFAEGPSHNNLASGVSEYMSPVLQTVLDHYSTGILRFYESKKCKKVYIFLYVGLLNRIVTTLN